jgi:hypothetical protein
MKLLLLFSLVSLTGSSLFAQDSLEIVPKQEVKQDTINKTIENTTATPFYFEMEFSGDVMSSEKSKKLTAPTIAVVQQKQFVTKPARSWRFVFEPSWTQGNGEMLYGLSAALGLKVRRHLWSLNFGVCGGAYYDYSSSYDIEEHRSIIGGGIGYSYYVLSLKNILNIGIGGTAGFWEYQFKRRYYNTADINSTPQNLYNEEYFFGGPQVRLEIGYGILHVFARETLLLGSDVAFMHNYGLVFKF